MKQVMGFAMVLVLAASCDAHSVGRLAEIAVIDRDSGATLPCYFYRGEYWVAGNPGARYAIEIRNRISERVLAVTSIDGINVLSGATAAWDQTGYVFGASERYQITGWRKSDATVAAFTFTDSPNSYAERTGRPANVGIIGVALFRERQPQQSYVPPTIGGSPADLAGTRRDEPASALPSESRAKSFADFTGGAGSAQAPTAGVNSAAPSVSSLRAPKLGTGHGEAEYSSVNYTEFLRLQPQPNEIVRIHYDSLANLFAMGIIRRPAPSAVNPFPGSSASPYVPDPPG
jgi:hypothetical protein